VGKRSVTERTVSGIAGLGRWTKRQRQERQLG
jgi:hypothetical protein